MRTYLVGWPNGTWSVLGFSSKPSKEDLDFCIDAIGDPSVASIFRVKPDAQGDFMFDLPKSPSSLEAKPELPCGFLCGDLVPVRLYGDLGEEWKQSEREAIELDGGLE
jgi:hypothetical protein